MTAPSAVCRTQGIQPVIALIRPPSDCVEDDRLEPPLGLLYIAAVLRSRGYKAVSIVDLSGSHEREAIEGSIGRIPRADVYGIGIVCANHVFAERCVQHIRRLNPLCYVVAGGPNPSALPELSLCELGVDAVVVGEGEDAFCQLVSGYCGGKPHTGIVCGVGRSNIDTYPFPARDMVDLRTYHKELLGQPAISVLTTRGCPHSCLHCNSNVMGGGNPRFRTRTVENILGEIDLLCTDGYRTIRFVDDNFTANPQLPRLLNSLKGYGVRFRIFSRLEALNEETCQLLQSAGCAHVSIGLESLNPDNLRVLGKARQANALNQLRVAKEHGMTLRVSFMVGLPFDTDENIEEYFSRAANLDFDEFEVHPLIPFPGTRLAQDPGRWGYRIVQNDFRHYVLVGRDRATTFALAHTTFGPEDVARWRTLVSALLRARGKVFMRESLVAR